MAIRNNAAFESALESAGDETISELEDAVEVEAPEPWEEEHADDADESDQEIGDDSDHEEDVEAESEDTEEVEDSPSVFEWSGNPDELPSHIEHDGKVYDLTKVYKSMQGGFTKKMQELAEIRRDYESRLKQLEQDKFVAERRAAIANDPRPANPTEDMSFEAQQKRWDEITEWTARNAYRKMIENGDIPDPTQMSMKLQEQERVAAISNRISMIQSQPGWSEEVEASMVEIANGNQYWAQALQSDDGALALFNHAKTQHDAAELRKKAAEFETDRVRRQAKASKNASPKHSIKKSAADTFKDEAFKDLPPEKRIDAVIDAAFDSL